MQGFSRIWQQVTSHVIPVCIIFENVITRIQFDNK